jgi:hypothetical protein
MSLAGQNYVKWVRALMQGKRREAAPTESDAAGALLTFQFLRALLGLTKGSIGALRAGVELGIEARGEWRPFLSEPPDETRGSLV